MKHIIILLTILLTSNFCLSKIARSYSNNEVDDKSVTGTITYKYENKLKIAEISSSELNITLYLEPSDGLFAGTNTKVFKTNAAATDPKDQFVEINYFKNANIMFYEDLKNYASLLVKKGINNVSERIQVPAEHLKFQGLVGNVHIKRAPAKFSNLPNEEGQFKDYISTRRHSAVPASNIPINQLFQSIPTSQGSNSNNVVPDTVYVQVLVVMDYKLFSLFNSENSAIEYILSYWHAVDLRYRAFQNPNIRLNIAGIILAQDTTVLPYLKGEFVKVKNEIYKNGILFEKIFFEFSNYLSPNTDYNEATNSLKLKTLGIEYDVVMNMINYELYRPLPDTGIEAKELYSYKLLGGTSQNGVCDYNTGTRVTYAYGFLTDHGNFDTLSTAAHELGHALGGNHDPNAADGCPENDGYIMSSIIPLDDNGLYWSNCTINSIKNLIKSKSCLYNKPDIGEKIPLYLPGKIFKRDELCTLAGRQLGYQTVSVACPVMLNNCTALHCMSSPNKCYVVDYPPPEGTDCGDGHYCIDAKCISKTDT